MTPSAVELRRLTKTYREGNSEWVVFRDVDATIRTGEIVVLVGRSGSGKPTLLNLISGIGQPSTGPSWWRGPIWAPSTSGQSSPCPPGRWDSGCREDRRAARTFVATVVSLSGFRHPIRD